MLWNVLKFPLQDGAVNSGGSAGTTNKAAGGGGAPINQVDTKGPTQSGVSNHQVYTNHIIQFPKQPYRDDGKWVALGSLIGSVFGKLANRGLMNQVKDAESQWKRINEQLHNKGNEIWGMAKPEWAKMRESDQALDRQVDWEISGRDQEYDYANALNSCNDEIHAKLCEFIKCGYKADYKGIYTRVVADAEAMYLKEKREAIRNINRYAIQDCCDISLRLSTAKVQAVVGNVSRLRELERQKQWEINAQLFKDGSDLFERHRTGRLAQAMDFDKAAVGGNQFLYGGRQKNYYDLTNLGGEMLAATGRNSGWLADSLRKSAEKQTGGLAQIGGLIAAALGIFFCGPDGFCKPSDSCS